MKPRLLGSPIGACLPVVRALPLGLRKGRFGGCRPGGADASSFLVVVAMPPSVNPRRSGAAGGVFGVCREAFFVVCFGRGAVTPTTPLVGPSPVCGRTVFRDEIGLSTAPGGAFARDRIGRLCAAIADRKT